MLGTPNPHTNNFSSLSYLMSHACDYYAIGSATKCGKSASRLACDLKGKPVYLCAKHGAHNEDGFLNKAVRDNVQRSFGNKGCKLIKPSELMSKPNKSEKPKTTAVEDRVKAAKKQIKAAAKHCAKSKV